MTKKIHVAALALVALAGALEAAPAGPDRSYLVERDGRWSRVERRQGETLSVRRASPPATVQATPSLASEADRFLPYEAYPVGSWPEAVVVADLNGDGRNDVALVTSTYSDPANDQQVHVFLQQSDGSLRRMSQHPVGGRPETLAAGDLNGDGRADLVAGNGAAIVVLLQDVDGTLQSPITIPTESSDQVTVADLNGDGRDDVASIAWGCAGGAQVRYQGPDGTLGAPVTAAVACRGYDEIDAGDTDADGRTDLVVMSGQGIGPDFGVLRQQADGTLGAPAYYGVDGLTDGIGIGDVDGDGRNDVTVSQASNRPNAAIRTLAQLSDGTFATPVRYDSYDIPEPVVVADVDLDGRSDVVVAHGGWSQLGVYRQGATGLEPEQLYAVPYASHYQPQGLAVGDVNGDRLPDIVIADYNHGLVVVRQRDTLAPQVSITSPAPFAALYTGINTPFTWSASDNVAVTGVTVSASTNGGATWTTPAFCGSLSASARSCSWAPAAATTQGLLRVLVRDAAANASTSTVPYTAVTPTLDLLNPVAGETWGIGTRRRFRWTSTLYANETLQIGLSRDGSTTQYGLAALAAPNTGVFDWTVTGPATTTAHVRLRWNAYPGYKDDFSPTFTIAAPSVRVTAPNTAVSWTVGTTQTITWAHNLGTLESVRVELSRDGGLTWQPLGTVANDGETTGSFTWSVSGARTKKARVRVVWTSSGSVLDVNDTNFSIR